MRKWNPPPVVQRQAGGSFCADRKGPPYRAVTHPCTNRPVGRVAPGAPFAKASCSPVGPDAHIGPVPPGLLRKGYFLNGQKVTKEPLKGRKAYAAQRSGLMAFPP